MDSSNIDGSGGKVAIKQSVQFENIRHDSVNGGTPENSRLRYSRRL
jgi:hypothetical protein